MYAGLFFEQVNVSWDILRVHLINVINKKNLYKPPENKFVLAICLIYY